MVKEAIPLPVSQPNDSVIGLPSYTPYIDNARRRPFKMLPLGAI